MDLHSLPTPSLILDFDRVRRNAQRMGDRVSALGVRLRPHVKTHKCVELARLQTAGHSGSITVSTLAEARAFAAHGFTDVTYAVPIEPGKYPAAIELAARCLRFAVLTDSPDVPGPLGAMACNAGVTLDIFLEVDCGDHRCGVDPDSPSALTVSRLIAGTRGLRFAGILTHAGHAYHAASREARRAVARQERDVMVRLAERLRADGVETPTVSIGSTPSITAIDHLEGVDEVRPGNYIFFDAFQAGMGTCDQADCALTVLAAVVHRDRSRRQVVLDAGAIALSKDLGPVDVDAACGFGRVLDLEGRDLGLTVRSVSQEHGKVAVPGDQTLDRLAVGTRVRVLANHSCLTAAQHSHFHVLDGGRIVDRWAIHRGW